MAGRTVTDARLRQVWFGLQRALNASPRSEQRRIGNAMRVIDDLRMARRREAILAAGRRARKPDPKYRGEKLGSNEAYTFFDGYASTHPGFVNPYRSR